ncbi:pyridoxamine 5'-phosphate oxidase family protein [Kitasatospora sp. A2-31]|uniref:pyridoxamine 5'-phosphate oxidase family protein n=1 Tax=Kitasatospora sp. A2-31 TaxID=2916414 RepID=UPI001EECD85F|nr:pyridoxamine 5'-phosphate oxidase family protein [Kitasatospora sp. A2-31]MCG6498513.1 pyridoxamine 5'-phosphate oxidase family protein [Kitasatospora sp. A2-31]
MPASGTVPVPGAAPSAGGFPSAGGHPPGGDVPPRHLVPLERAEALRLLAGVPFGRIVFTSRALPAVRPVNHLLLDDAVVIRTHDGAALTAAAVGAQEGVVVAYEADAIDPVTRLGWSVVVIGYARPVTDPDRLARYREALRPWVAASMDHTVAIRPDLVTGFRLVAEAAG